MCPPEGLHSWKKDFLSCLALVSSTSVMAISPTANGSAANRPMTLAPPSLGRPRKYSLPVIYPRPSLSVYAAETTKEQSSRRRKFSQVGQVVGHRLSTTIGWRSPISQQDVVNQAKSLCGRYLRAKLRSCSAVHKKLGLQRLKSVSNLACGSNTAEIANELRWVTFPILLLFLPWTE